MLTAVTVVLDIETVNRLQELARAMTSETYSGSVESAIRLAILRELRGQGVIVADVRRYEVASQASGWAA